MNKQLWKLYKESKRGKDCIALFSLDTDSYYSDNGVGAELNHLIGREAIAKILSSY